MVRMKVRLPLLFCALASGGVLGGVGLSVLHAQTKPPAFYVADFELMDPEGIKPHREEFLSTLEPFGGRFIVRGGTVAKLEGDAPKGRFIVIAFDNVDKAMAWYNSAAYSALRSYRQKSGRTDAFVIEGTANQ
ncbi:DUF1330 domain-containing protein [Bradyrhizobium sp. WSM 1738]|uniref:DUF1330 domain-containing protein n=1 Tax=Bradyrhizobium hereditatis TaxID=2821405 RepID=UPI001CE3A618|nr:DUF1330 domain-containing protein [Bradyrhizobium hereditatis]MCA6119122.1 DUF1330 domain-containing protein [Bradyrhizobium hereditatis]